MIDNYVRLQDVSEERFREIWDGVCRGKLYFYRGDGRNIMFREAKRRGIELIDPTNIEQQTKANIWY